MWGHHGLPGVLTQEVPLGVLAEADPAGLAGLLLGRELAVELVRLYVPAAARIDSQSLLWPSWNKWPGTTAHRDIPKSYLFNGGRHPQEQF